ncbi:MAG: S1C family serine protease [Pirellulaceae bacterium]
MRRHWFWMVWLAMPGSGLAADIPAPVAEAEQQRMEVMARAVRSAVSVFSGDGRGGGSGVVITPDGFALTNYHVVSPLGDYMKCGMSSGDLYDAVVVSIDPTGDVALIKLFGRDDFPHAELGDSEGVQVGQWCFAVGNPFLLATNLQPTVTSGIVSGIHRYQYPSNSILEYTDCIQTDAAINPGNSGGPLFNARGRLIGVNGRCSFEKRGRVNVGVGYAISINQIKKFLGYLRSGRILDHATLGATVAQDADGRVLVSNILESSDAYRRGLRYGDEVLALGGRSTRTANEFKNVLGTFPNGWRVPLRYRRDGIRHDIHVRLGALHRRQDLLDLVQRQPPHPDLPPEKKPGDDKQPRRVPQPRAHTKKPVPDEFAKFIKARAGYSNYYFNEVEQSRVWSRFQEHGDFSKAPGIWTLRGALASGGTVEFLLGEERSSATFPEGPASVAAGQDISEQLAPQGSGGLLAALHLWRRLLVAGPDKFGEWYYLGTAPRVDQERLLDVLVGTFDVTESQFWFDPATGKLVALEMFPDAHVDPCEIEFLDYRAVGQRAIPHRLLVRHGDSVFAEIRLNEVVVR